MVDYTALEINGFSKDSCIIRFHDRVFVFCQILRPWGIGSTPHYRPVYMPLLVPEQERLDHVLQLHLWRWSAQLGFEGDSAVFHLAWLSSAGTLWAP